VAANTNRPARGGYGLPVLALLDEPYRAPAPIGPDPYAKAWAELRWRRRVGWAAFAFNWLSVVVLFGGYVAIDLGGVLCIDCQLSPAGPYLAAACGCSALLLPLAVWFAARAYRRRVLCPQCGNGFGTKRRCGRCGIAIGTPKSAVVETENPYAGD
jgi:hypothetical protein